MKSINQCRLAAGADARFVLALQRKFSNELGFIPGEALRHRIKLRQVSIALENGEPAGFILAAQELSQAKHIRPIFQAAICYDAQRRHHGLSLVGRLSQEARENGQSIIQCFCRQDIDANAFWRSAGFVQVALRDVNAVRGTPCVLWRKPLNIMTPAELSLIPHNHGSRGAAGRAVHRFAWHSLPKLDLYSPADIERQLRQLELCA